MVIELTSEQKLRIREVQYKQSTVRQLVEDVNKELLDTISAVAKEVGLVDGEMANFDPTKLTFTRPDKVNKVTEA